MRDAVARRQGQPVLFLALLLAGWCLLRIVTWENPWPLNSALSEPFRLTNVDLVDKRPDTPRSARLPGTPLESTQDIGDRAGLGRMAALPSAFDPVVRPEIGEPTPLPTFDDHFDRHRRAAGHNLLFAASMANLPMPRSVSEMLDRRREANPPQRERAGAHRSDWRSDSWLMLRPAGNRSIESGGRPPAYGNSQAGTVLTFRLGPASGHDPAVFVRASRALVQAGESEMAVGLRIRPIARIPIDLHLETRATDRPGSTEIRPAVFLAGGFDEVVLPGGLDARGYVQAGYVHGRFATGFIDGKAIATREVARFDLGRLSVGAGTWGGAQKDSSRLDIGPSLSLDLRLGQADARLEADYRWRVAGHAEPGDGGVLTLSTGF